LGLGLSLALDLALPSGDIPDANRLIIRTADEPASVRAKRQGRHRAGVAAERCHDLSARGINELDHIAVGGNRRELSTGMEGDGSFVAIVTFRWPHLLTGAGIPGVDLLVAREELDPSAIGGKSDIAGRISELLESEHGNRIFTGA